MYHPVKYQKNMTLLPVLLEDGLKKEKLNICDLITEKGFIIFKILKNSLEFLTIQDLLQKQFVMQELVLVIKKQISKDKSSCSKNIIQMQKLLKTLVLDLTGKDLGLTPFWNDYTSEISKLLWLPIKTDYADLDMSLWNGLLKNPNAKSWFSTNLQISKTPLKNFQMTFLASLMFLLQKTMDLERLNLEKKEKKLLMSSRQIKFYPTNIQKNTINQWLGVRRWIYNNCLDAINKKLAQPNLKDLRKQIINGTKINEQTWLNDIEYDLKDEAIRDFLHNYKTNIAKFKIQKKPFRIQFKSKKLESQNGSSLSILSKKWNKKKNFYSSIFNINNIKTSETLPKILPHTSRLLKTPLNEYYFSIPRIVIRQYENQVSSIISLDPGMKNYLTGYDPSGKIITYGKRDIEKIAKLLHWKRKLIGKKDTEKKIKKKNKIRKAILRIIKRIKNLIADLQRKVAKDLCTNYKNVLIPKLNFHTMKKLNKKSKEKIISLSHCYFVDYLKNKSREYDCNIIEVNESYTSKTCTRCGFQKENLKNKDIYECDNCSLTISRDINGARNIFLRYISKRC
jgi:putative transposase